MSAPDFRDVAALYATARTAYVSSEPWLNAGQVLDALDGAVRHEPGADVGYYRNLLAQEARRADVLRAAIRERLGESAWLFTDVELAEALRAQGGEPS